MTKLASLKRLYGLVLWALLITLTGVPSSGTAMSIPIPLRGADKADPVQMTDQVLSVSLAPVDAAEVRQTVTAQMSEDFEDAWPATGWQLVDNSTRDDGENLFGQRYCHPHTRSGAAWTVGGGDAGSHRSCTGNYPNNANTWAVYGPVDLSTATRASLSFHVWGRTQPTQGSICPDFLFAGSSVNQTNFKGIKYCGDTTNGEARNGYHKFTVDLTDRLGISQVWVAFAFISDSSITDIGLTVDDIALDVSSSAAGADAWSYLPLISASSPSAQPPSESAFERLQWTLKTPGAQGIFKLDTDRMIFTQTNGQKCAGELGDLTCVDTLPVEVKSYVRGRLLALDFRASPNWFGTHGAGGSGAYGAEFSEATVTNPDPGQIRIAWDRSSSTSRSTFTGDLVGDVMTVQYFYWNASLVNGLYTSHQESAQFSSPIIWVPASEWTPLAVTDVEGEDQPSRCLRVSWKPAPDYIPAAPVQEYILQFAEVSYTHKEVARVPSDVTIWEDCSPAARNCYLTLPSYHVIAVAANGQQSLPAKSPGIFVWRMPCLQ